MILTIALNTNVMAYDFIAGESLASPYSGALRATQAGRVVTRRDDGLLEERIYLLGKNGTTSQQQGVVYERTVLDGYGEGMRQYAADPNVVFQDLYLREQADGEASARRALLYDLQIRPLSDSGFTHLLNLNLSRFEMVLVRDEWESDTANTTLTGTNLAAGGKITIDDDDMGSLAGRLARLKLEPGASAGTGAATLLEHWVGIRPFYYGVSGFTPEWDWASGDFHEDTSESGGTVTTTFAGTTSMAKRITLKLSDIAVSNYDHFVGEYTLVMGYIVGGGGGAQIAFKVLGDGVESEPIYSGSTASLVATKEVGTIRIPSQSIRNVTVDLADIEIQLWAELIASTSSLAVTKVYAVPNKHMVKLNGTIDSAKSSGFIELHMLPENKPLQVNSDGTTETFGEAEIYGWEAPAAGGALVYVGASSQGVGGGVDVELDIVNRWDGYRYDTP